MPQKKKSVRGSKQAKKTKKPLESLSQTHGKEEKFQPTTLDQVWGESGNTKYGTTDVNDYIRKLENLNTTDLQTHAHTIGFVPIDDRVTLIKKLIGEFKKHISSFGKPTHSAPQPAELSDEVKKILSEGR